MSGSTHAARVADAHDLGYHVLAGRFTLSVQWGEGNYCRLDIMGVPTHVEIAAWETASPAAWTFDGQVIGWVPVDRIDLIEEMLRADFPDAAEAIAQTEKPA